MFRESPWHFTNFLHRIDKFGQPIPGFNIKGQNEVKTAIGGIMTAIIVSITLGYFATKFNGLLNGDNPIIN